MCNHHCGYWFPGAKASVHQHPLCWYGRYYTWPISYKHITFTVNDMGKFNFSLIHWGRVTHICINKLTIIGSDNGLSPGRRQAIIWTSAGILLIGPLGTNFSEILIEIQTFSLKKIHLKMSSGKWWPQCVNGIEPVILGLTHWGQKQHDNSSNCFTVTFIWYLK